MNNPTNPGRRFFGALIPAFVIASGIAWGGPVYTIKDGGVPKNFELVEDEVSLFRKGSGLSRDVKSDLANAVIVKDFGSRVVVRFPQTDWKKAIGARAFGGASFEPVAYVQGESRNDGARRVITSDVLASGADAAELVKISGAKASKASKAAGYVILSFASPAEALAGTEALRKAGKIAEPQLRRQMSKRAVPLDELFPEQWHLQNTGQGNGLPGVDINPLIAWDYQPDPLAPNELIAEGFTGAGVTIAIVDDGLELDHQDLAANTLDFVEGAGGPHYDFNDDDDNPAPRFGDNHGTACGGVAAGRGNNGLGVSGSGPQASLIGLRLISGLFTDQNEADAFTWGGGAIPTVVDISSNSWGPIDDVRLEGPGLLALNGLRSATQTGRGGKGTVFCWAGGNGGDRGDNVNMDGYANSRYVIAVGAVGNDGVQSYYSESGSPLLVCAPSNGGPLGITTTDLSGGIGYDPSDYTDSFGGTSSATPLVSGVVSLMLQANPELGYRDVMEILASTASKIDSANPGWTTNGAGFFFNHAYGGGMVDASAAVIRAVDWVNLKPEAQEERILATPAVPVAIPDGNPTGISRNFDFTGTDLRVEHVEVQLDIKHSHRSDLAITLKSPSGQISRLIEKRTRPGNSDVDYTDGNLGWIFSTTQHWGEDSAGTWTVSINDTTAGTSGTLQKARVRLFGTPEPSNTRFTFDKKITNVSEVAPTVSLRVQRLGSSAGNATVEYYVSDRASALAGVDFTPTNGTLTFADGETEKTITVQLSDDTLTEGDERFYVVLRNPSVGTFGGISVQAVEIDDNESNAVTVRAIDSAAFEKVLTFEAPDTGTFRISRTIASPSPLPVKYSFTAPPDIPVPGKPAFAQHIVDFAELPLIATIPGGEDFVDVVVSPKNDRFSEGTELIELVITPDAAYNVGLPDRAQINLVDNDLVPVQVDTNVSSVVESSGTDVVFTIIRDTPQLDTALNVVLTAGGTAEPRIDYDPPFPGVVTIPPGSATTTLTVRINDNNVFNPMKTIVLGVSQGPEYKEGFFRTVEVRIFDDEPTPDTVKPSVTIETPLKGARISHPAQITATGTAIDNPDKSGNLNAAQVRYRLNQGPWNVATLTATDWSADLTSLAAFGDNTLDVYSIDEAGNESKLSSVSFVHVKERNITTNVVGSGTVSSNFVGTRPFEVGQPYTIVARPTSSTNMFAGWSGRFIATPRALTFTMPDEDISLTATFTSALLDPSVVGKFAGLVGQSTVRRGSAFELSSSGFLNASVSKSGRFSAQLNYGGTKYSFRGEFTGDGRFIGSVPRRNNTALQLDLQIDLNSAGTKKMTGTVSADGLLSGVDCPRALTPTEASVVTTGMAKTYTFELPMRDRITASKPQGTGVATLTLDPKGNVRWRGVLPDGTPATQSAYLSKDKTWPLFVSNFAGRGMMLGTITHDSAPATTDLAGSLSWEKKPDARDRLFPLGFIIEDAELLGSAYVAPASGQRVLSAFATANGTLTLEAGNLQVPFGAKTVAISERNKVSVSPVGVDALALNIQTSRGAVSGTFIHPVTSKKVKISGVVLQKAQRVSGNFIGSTPSETALQTGRVAIGVLVP